MAPLWPQPPKFWDYRQEPLYLSTNQPNNQTNCMCALVCDHVHTRASMCEDQSLTSSVFLCRSPHYCLRLSLSLNLEHTYLLVWLASGAQELPHFSGLSDTPHYVWPLMKMLGILLRSSCLFSKPCTYWGSSPAPVCKNIFFYPSFMCVYIERWAYSCHTFLLSLLHFQRSPLSPRRLCVNFHVSCINDSQV